MADAVTVQTLLDGPRNVIIKLTNLSDGTGEAAVLKADPATFFPVPARFSLNRVEYALDGMMATLLWEGSANKNIVHLSGTGFLDWTSTGGLPNNALAPTGKILLTTTSAGNNDSYVITLFLKKKY